MAAYCLNCRLPVEDSKKFCGQCGQALVPLEQAEAELRRELQGAPRDTKVLGQLVDLLEADDSREGDLAVARLQLCDALLARERRGDELERVRDEFKGVRLDLLPVDAMELMIRCFATLYADPDHSVGLADEAEHVTSEAGGRLGDESKRAWIKTCLELGEAQEKRGDHSQARRLYNVALGMDASHEGALASQARLRGIEARQRTRTMLVWGVPAILIVLAAITFWFLNTGELGLAVAAEAQPVRVTLTHAGESSPNAGPSPVLKPDHPGHYRARLVPGSYALQVTRDGCAAWETTLVVAGARTTQVTAPALRSLSEVWGLEADGSTIEWEGTARGQNMMPYSVVLRVSQQDGWPRGTATFPTIPCTGILRLDQSTANELLFSWNVSRGTCGNGKIRLRRAGDSVLEYAFLTNDANEVARGFLRPNATTPVATQATQATDASGVIPVVVVPASDAQAPGGSAFVAMQGRWGGTVNQDGQQYPVSMELRDNGSGGLAGTINYPSLSCTGRLEWVGARADEATLREILESGGCVPGGQIRMRQGAAGTLVWTWYYPDGHAGATSQLTHN